MSNFEPSDKSKYLIANAYSLPEGMSMHVVDKPYDFFVIRHNGELLAYENECPHQFRTLAWEGEKYLDDEGNYFKCQRHGALFSITDGTCINGTCPGKALKKLELYEEDHQIYLLLNP